jgi:hypothetical protein
MHAPVKTDPLSAGPDIQARGRSFLEGIRAPVLHESGDNAERDKV